MQQILSYMRKAIEDYNMISNGDKIAIGLSGGKDSLTLLLTMHRLQEFLPIKFEIMALTIDPGFETFDVSPYKELCENLGVEYVVEKSDIKTIVFDIRKEKNPCSLCANLRRGIVNSTAKAHGCNKIALGHHQDDVLETFFLSLFYEGTVNTFSPVTHLSRVDLYSIRPMVYVPEKEIRTFVKNANLPVIQKCCPMDGFSKREDMKTMIKNFEKQIPNLRANLSGAIRRSGIKGW